jgi:ABC-type Fe3+/spermidine/putrescine transport system ATPase subunit
MKIVKKGKKQRSSSQATPQINPRDYEIFFEAVCKHYPGDTGRIAALDSVTLGIRRGEFISILGPEGAGKSTVLRLIAGFEQPDFGNVYIDGQTVNTIPPEQRKIPMVFQDLALFPHLSVRRNIAYALRFAGLEEETSNALVESALVRVNLQKRGNNFPADLSPGEKQRTALARALVLKPRIILLDEPFFLLDAKMRLRLAREIKNLQLSLGITMIYGTSNASEALSLSDRIAFLGRRRVLQLGIPEDLYYRPKTREVADFIGESNGIEGVVGKIKDKFHVFITGHNRLEIPQSAVVLRGMKILKEGMCVCLYFKPEHLVSGKAPGGLCGRVTGKQFSGPTTGYTVDFQGLSFRIARNSHLQALKLGSEVSLTFKEKSVIVFETDGEGKDAQHL